MAKNGEVSILVKIKEEGAKALSSIADSLESMKGKAAAFGAAVTGALGLAVNEYAKQEAAVFKLEASLKAQGLEVDKLSLAYQKLATELANTTTFGDEQILSAIAIGQSMAGNIPITKELTEATLNFAAATGTDLESAFSMVGKSIGTNTNALARQGVELDENATAAEKMAEITRVLSSRFEGQAEAQTKGLGSLIQLKKAVGEVFESVGKQLAPAITSLSKQLTEFVKSLENDNFTKWAAIIGVASAAVAGLVAALGTLVTIMPVIVAGLGVLLTPISAIVAAVAGLALAWKTDFLGIQEITAGVVYAVREVVANFVKDVSGLFSDFGSILKAAFTLDTEGISKSFADLKTRLAGIANETKDAFNRGYQSTAALRKTLSSENAKEDVKQAEISATQASEIIKAANAEVHEEKLKSQKELAEEADKAAKEQKRLDLDLAKHKADADKAAADESEKKWQTVAGHVEAFTSKGLQGAVSSGLEALTNSFLPGFGGAAGAVFDLLSKDTDEFINTITQLFSADFIGNVMKNIVILVEKLPEILSGIIDFIVENMPALAEKMIAAIIANLPEIASALAKAFSDPKFWVELSVAMGKGIVKGIKDAAGDITEAIRKAFKDAAKIDLNVGGGGGGGGVLKSITKSLGFSQGGLIPHLATGGYVKGYAGGGLIDNTLAALTPGEFVVNRASAQANAGALQAINNSNGRPLSGGVTVNITVNGGMLGDEGTAREFARAVDAELYKLRLGNESRAFDTGL